MAWSWRRAALCLLPVAVLLALSAGAPAGTAAQAAPALPPGFHDQVVVSGLDRPTSLRFAPDGRVFVAEQGGAIVVLDGLSGARSVFADLSAEVDNYWDRGLLGLAVDPGWPAKPYVYALYAYDAPPGMTAPVWYDACPTPPGPTTSGCTVQGRLVRLTADAAGTAAASSRVLVQDWCQQFPSHSVGDLRFGPDGALYASGGEGASFLTADYGQFGGNPCGDPPNEGGSLRSQSYRRTDAGAVLGGSVIRIDPATGEGLAGNPGYSSAAPAANTSRIVAYGLRNPFRLAFRPGTGELWIGDVGEYLQEEVDRLPSLPAPATNFGWPCYEGADPHATYMQLGLPLCTGIDAQVTAPYFSYDHANALTEGGRCPSDGGSSITGLSFYSGGAYPGAYDGALVFADHTRNCIWAMLPGPGGAPDPGQVQLLESAAGNPVDLETGPGGDLYYVDLEGGAIHRISYATPAAVATADRTNGDAPLAIAFDGSGSTSPDGGPLAYRWDFGDGSTDTSASPTHTFTRPGSYAVRLTVTDDTGATDVSAPIAITAGNTPPAPVIDLPTASTTWSVGQTIAYAGHATDQQDPAGALALTWSLVLHHCITPTTCHTHLVESHAGASGTFSAPDHDYPSYLELQLTATDTGGLSTTASVLLDPKTTTVTVASSPAGARVFVNGLQQTTPYTTTAIVNSTLTLQAASPQTIGGRSLSFSSWSDGGAASHTLAAPAAAATYTATFTAPPASGGGGGGGPSGGGFPDLGLTFVADATTVAPGGGVRLDITVANTGLGGSTGDTLALTLPAGVVATLAKSDRGPGCVIAALRIDCDLDFTSSGQAAHLIVLVQLPSAPGTYTIGGVATSGFPADGNPANNKASIDLVVRDPSAPTGPYTPPPARPTIRLLAGAKPGRVVQAVRAGRYVVAAVTARIGHARSAEVSAARQDGRIARPAWVAAGTTVNGSSLRRPAASVVRAVADGALLRVRVRIAPGSIRRPLVLRLAAAGPGGRTVVVVPLHMSG